METSEEESSEVIHHLLINHQVLIPSGIDRIIETVIVDLESCHWSRQRLYPAEILFDVALAFRFHPIIASRV